MNRFIKAIFRAYDLKVKINWFWLDFEAWLKSQAGSLQLESVDIEEIFCENLVEFGVWWLSAQVAQAGRLEQLPVLLADKPVDVVDVD